MSRAIINLSVSHAVCMISNKGLRGLPPTLVTNILNNLPPGTGLASVLEKPLNPMSMCYEYQMIVTNPDFIYGSEITIKQTRIAFAKDDGVAQFNNFEGLDLSHALGYNKKNDKA